MDSAPTLETVCQAIKSLYHNPDISGKEKASAWLGELQLSVYAWKIADELLHRKFDLESCYFAAQTIRTKIQYYFLELPVTSHESLRDSLLEHLSHVTEETASVIVTQLCLALADLALQMHNWKTPVPDLITRFSQSTQSIPVLLEILTVLPEEIGSRSLRLGANRRGEVTEALRQVSPQVVQILLSSLEVEPKVDKNRKSMCLQSPEKEDTKLHAKVFRCLGSWYSVAAIPVSDPNLHALMKCIFYVLVNPTTSSSLHEAATDCLCNSLVLVGDTEKDTTLTQLLCEGVFTLQESYHMAVAQEDPEKAMNYCRIFTELAESLLDPMLETPGQGLGNLQTLEILLMCVGHHDYEVAEITFNVWYRLSEGLYKANNETLNEMFQPYVQRLIVSLTRHCEMEPDQEGIPEETDDFGEFRQRCTDLVKDVVFLVGSAICFRQMFENLKNQGPNATWSMTEASLFIMAAVAKNVIPSENMIVPQVIYAIFNLPTTTHVAVRYTSTKLLGELCEWIEKHPEYLEPVLNWLLSCLQQSQLSSVSASALQNICATCRKQMVNHFQGLLQIVQALDTFGLSADAALGLLRGTALILTHLPTESVTEGLRQLCQTQIAPLAQLLKEPDTSKDRDVAVWLDRLAAIFRNTNPNVPAHAPHPCQPVVEEIWPVLSQTCERYQLDVRIVERCCRCIRFAVRCVSRHSLTLLQPLVTQMVQLYAAHKHSCFLYLGSILVDEYGMDSSCIDGLIEMLQAFCVPTFTLLAGPNALRNHPDTIDDLFRLCTRFLQQAPVQFLQATMFSTILECALAACALDHRDANASVMKFFYDLIRVARTHDDSATLGLRHSLIQGVLMKYGQDLTSALLKACIFHLSTYMFSDIADVVYELIHFDSEKKHIGNWLQEALRLLPTLSTGGGATPHQMAEFHQKVLSAENVKTITTALRDFSRLFR